MVVVLLGVALAPYPAGPATASCAGPSLDLEPREVLPRGGALTVRGDAFADGCQDTGSCSGVLGCQSCDYGPPPVPLEDVPLLLRQGGREWELGVVDAGTADEGALGRTVWQVTVPADAAQGPATLVAGDGGLGTEVRVRLR